MAKLERTISTSTENDVKPKDQDNNHNCMHNFFCLSESLKFTVTVIATVIFESWVKLLFCGLLTFFLKFNILKNSFRISSKVSNILDPD